jgi:hypothetical protein
MKFTEKQIIKDYNKLKFLATKAVNKKQWNSAIDRISACAHYAYMFNHIYADIDLENMIHTMSQELIKNNNFKSIKNRYVFYDSFGISNMGISTQYIRALKQWDVEFLCIVNSYEIQKSKQLLAALKQCPQAITYIVDNTKSNIEQINDIYNIVCEFRPDKAFMYLTPWDVVALTVFSVLSNTEKYQINLTDHAFWLGASVLDYCIEFRNYGCNVSIEERGLKQEQILLQPFYPLDIQEPFEGLPTDIDNAKIIIFSGGAYYKVYGDNFKYFELLKDIVDKYPQVTIIYAGWGDEKPFVDFIKKYHYEKQIFLLGFRKDLTELMTHCDIYLGTYPMGGGLMTQYAAVAAKPYISLIQSAKDDFADDLIGHNFSVSTEKLNFSDIDDFFKEFDKLIVDKEYRINKGLRLKDAILSEQQFNLNLQMLVNTNKNICQIKKISIDYQQFMRQCIETQNSQKSIWFLKIAKLLGVKVIWLLPKTTIPIITSYLKNKLFK